MSWRSWLRSWPGLLHPRLNQRRRSCFQAHRPPPCCWQGASAPHLLGLSFRPGSCPSPEQRIQGSEGEPTHSQESHTMHCFCSSHPVTRSTRDKTGGDYIWACGYQEAGNSGLSWRLPTTGCSHRPRLVSGRLRK